MGLYVQLPKDENPLTQSMPSRPKRKNMGQRFTLPTAIIFREKPEKPRPSFLPNPSITPVVLIYEAFIILTCRAGEVHVY